VLAISCVGALVLPEFAQAGPPFVTDDPEPVPLHSWELYLASTSARDPFGWVGTAPLFEANYGAVKDTQLHLIVPLAYSLPSTGAHTYGLGDIELGVKYRFVDERARIPQVGSFPLLELPTGSRSRGLGGGRLRAFLPLWLQKSWGAWTSYGGGGYWINPGPGNRNWIYVGGLVQRQLLSNVTVGTEVFHTTAAEADGASETRFNVGAMLDLGEWFHVIASVGRGLEGRNELQSYLALLVTFGRHGENAEAPRD
jgi:hypothetical protein